MIGRLELRRKIVSTLDQNFLNSTKRILDYIDYFDMENPSMFEGIKEEDQVIRFEWLTSYSHTVLAINTDESFYGFHLNVTSEEEFSFQGSSFSEVTSFLSKYIKNKDVKK